MVGGKILLGKIQTNGFDHLRAQRLERLTAMIFADISKAVHYQPNHGKDAKGRKSPVGTAT